MENSPSCSNSRTIKAVVDIHLNCLAFGKSCSESPIILQLKSDLSTINTTNMYRVLSPAIRSCVAWLINYRQHQTVPQSRISTTSTLLAVTRFAWILDTTKCRNNINPAKLLQIVAMKNHTCKRFCKAENSFIKWPGACTEQPPQYKDPDLKVPWRISPARCSDWSRATLDLQFLCENPLVFWVLHSPQKHISNSNCRSGTLQEWQEWPQQWRACGDHCPQLTTAFRNWHLQY